jgi:ATP-binding cassette subfamily B protein
VIVSAGVDPEDRLDRKAAGQILRRTGHMLRPYRRQLVVALALIVTFTLTTIAGPYLVRFGIDHGINEDDAGTLNLAVALYIGAAVGGYLINRVQIVLVSRVGEGFLRDMRNRVFHHLLRLSMPYYDREKAGVVVSRMTSDIDSLQELVQLGLLQFVSSVRSSCSPSCCWPSRRGSSCSSSPSPCRSSCSPASSSSATPTTRT